MMVLPRAATSPIPSASGFEIRISIPGEGLSHRIGTEWIEIVHGDHGAGFRAAISVAYENAKVIEKLKGLRFGERTAHEKGAQPAAKSVVNLSQQRAAEPRLGLAASESAIHGDCGVENLAASFWQLVEPLAQPFFEVLQHHRHNAHIGDLVASERFAEYIRGAACANARLRLRK